MSFKAYYFSEDFESKKKPIESLEVGELVQIMKDYLDYEVEREARARRASPAVYDGMKEKNFPSLEKSLQLTKQLSGRGIPLLTQFIDILKSKGLQQDSRPMMELKDRYGSQVLDIYVQHDPESPAFIRV